MEEYFLTPIPDLTEAREAKKGYRAHPINLRAAEAQEELVDVSDCGVASRNQYFYTASPPYYQRIPGSIEKVLLRKTVAEKLAAVNDKLKVLNLELFAVDGLRPLAIQNYFHDVWFPEKIRRLHPEWSDQQVVDEVEQYWARGGEGVDPLSPPPHATGAAVDLTLKRIDGDQLWMGTILEDVTREAHTDYLEHLPAELSFTREEGRKNRRLLYWLMIEAGFANNPTEWWHFSYGDQMWAKLKSAQAGTSVEAIYSSALSG